MYQELLRQHEVPIENASFCRFSAGLRRPNHLAAVGGILVFGGLAAIFAGLEFAGLRHQAHFAGKSPSYASLKSKRPTSVHRSGIGLESGGPDPLHIAFRRRTCQRRHLLRAFETACGPLGPEGRSLMENTPPKSVSGRGGIPVSGELAAIFTELEFAGLLNRQRWASKRPGYTPR
jgi:hypothetical protein